MILLLSSAEQARFWAKIAVEATDDVCWEWLASTRGWANARKYGHFVRSKPEQRAQGGPRSFYAHRVAWCASRGWPLNYLNDTLAILHECDNPLCCNPKHLTLGTQLGNVQDMIRKGRNRGGHSWNQQPPVEIPT